MQDAALVILRTFGVKKFKRTKFYSKCWYATSWKIGFKGWPQTRFGMRGVYAELIELFA